MSIRAIAEIGGSRPPTVEGSDFVALREMLRHVSPELGPILRVSSFVGAGEAAGGGYAGHAELYDLDGILRDTYGQPSIQPGVNDTLFGGGKGITLPGAMLSTVGEAIERGVAALVGCSPHLPSDRIIGSYDDMTSDGFPALDPDATQMFSDAQYDVPGFLYRRFTRDSIIQWVLGRRLVSGDPVFVPAQFVDMVHIYDPNEELVGYPVSGGLSCHTSKMAATYHGLTEVIERDSINVSWYTDNPPRRIVIDDDVRDVLGGFVDRLTLDHSQSMFLYHPSDVCSVATISAVGIQKWLSRRRYCAGGGADVVTRTALRKAAAEYGQTRATLSQSILAPGSAVGTSVQELFDWAVGRPLAEMTLFFQAIGYYGLAENEHLLSAYLGGPEITLEEIRATAVDLQETSSTGDRLDALLAELQTHDIDPIVLDYSHPDWRRLSVIKVYVPELTTPFLQSRPMLGHRRLADLRDSVMDATGSALPLPYP
ncbi:MAG: ribosomal protein methylthiotransferase accessory factor [Solirubrobacteraceae bacterium]|nr:ribosomal protein methylthiotransferase accessory factor [Solirubrobacteraceae bacterium]